MPTNGFRYRCPIFLDELGLDYVRLIRLVFPSLPPRTLLTYLFRVALMLAVPLLPPDGSVDMGYCGFVVNVVCWQAAESGWHSFRKRYRFRVH